MKKIKTAILCNEYDDTGYEGIIPQRGTSPEYQQPCQSGTYSRDGKIVIHPGRIKGKPYRNRYA
jgi:hypothetical protein